MPARTAYVRCAQHTCPSTPAAAERGPTFRGHSERQRVLNQSRRPPSPWGTRTIHLEKEGTRHSPADRIYRRRRQYLILYSPDS